MPWQLWPDDDLLYPLNVVCKCTVFVLKIKFYVLVLTIILISNHTSKNVISSQKACRLETLTECYKTCYVFTTLFKKRNCISVSLLTYTQHIYFVSVWMCNVCMLNGENNLDCLSAFFISVEPKRSSTSGYHGMDSSEKNEKLCQHSQNHALDANHRVSFSHQSADIHHRHNLFSFGVDVMFS